MKILTLLLISALLIGCEVRTITSPEDKINSMERPVIILANNQEGLAVQGADGEIAHWRETYYFAKTIRESGLKEGDVLIPNETNK